jgi:DNA-binding transcriptional LysR family regulator
MVKQSGRLDFNHLQTFYWVAKNSGFTAAAKALELPKSTVSRHIALLETRLGARLLERTTRRIALTEIGQLYLAHCERVMADAEEAERAVTAYTSQPRGLLRVGVPVTFARAFLAPLLPAFCRKYPELKLELVLGGALLDPVEQVLDVVIHVGRLQDSAYVVRKLGSTPQYLYASKEYLRKSGSPGEPAALATHEAIALTRSPKGTRWKLQTRDGEVAEEVKVEPRVAVADPVIGFQLAEAGLGVAMLPEFLATGSKKLQRVLPEWRPAEVEFFALYPARRLTAPKLRVFLDELEKNLSFRYGKRSD